MPSPRVALGANHRKCKKAFFLILIFGARSHQKNLLPAEAENMYYYLPPLIINIFVKVKLWMFKGRGGGGGAGLKLYFKVSGVICENLVEKFQQLGEMGEDCNFPHWGFVAKMLSKYKKIVYSLPLFGVRYKRIVKLEV